MLELSGVCVEYGPIRAVSRANIVVRDGEVVALIGANGAGKSSTLLAIAGVVPASSGSIMLGGKVQLRGLPSERVVREGVALVPEGRRILVSLTVLENLRLAGSTRRTSSLADALHSVYSLFPVLEDRQRQLAGLLSGGEQQQLAIGRALMSNPEVLLLDEPSLGLGPKIRDAVFDRIMTLNQRGVTILLVEQDARRALSIADRAYVMRQGEVVLEHDTKSGQLSSETLATAYLGHAAPSARID